MCEEIAARPGLSIGDTVFVASTFGVKLRKKMGNTANVPNVGTQRQFVQTRETLIKRLADSADHASWQEFFDLYWKLIYTRALKSGLSETEAEEVVQETVISVSKSLPKFEYDRSLGSFKNWLLRITMRRIADQFRKRPPEYHMRRLPTPGTKRTDTAARIPDPNTFEPLSEWDREWDNNLEEAAVERVKQAVDSKQFQIFDLHVRHGWPVSRLVEVLKVSAGQVYLAKHRISRRIQKELKLLKERLPE